MQHVMAGISELGHFFFPAFIHVGRADICQVFFAVQLGRANGTSGELRSHGSLACCPMPGRLCSLHHSTQFGRKRKGKKKQPCRTFEHFFCSLPLLPSLSHSLSPPHQSLLRTNVQNLHVVRGGINCGSLRVLLSACLAHGGNLFCTHSPER